MCYYSVNPTGEDDAQLPGIDSSMIINTETSYLIIEILKIIIHFYRIFSSKHAFWSGNTLLRRFISHQGFSPHRFSYFLIMRV